MAAPLLYIVWASSDLGVRAMHWGASASPRTRMVDSHEYLRGTACKVERTVEITEAGFRSSRCPRVDTHFCRGDSNRGGERASSSAPITPAQSSGRRAVILEPIQRAVCSRFLSTRCSCGCDNTRSISSAPKTLAGSPSWVIMSARFSWSTCALGCIRLSISPENRE